MNRNMGFSVTTLGTASAIPFPSRFPTAHLLNADERFYLIDCGEGTQLQLRRYKIKFQRIQHLFISHLHGDHVFGLPGLLSTLSMMGRKMDLQVYAPRDLQKNLVQVLYQYVPNMTFRVEFHPLNTESEEMILDDGKIQVWSFPLAHRIPACGFLFKEIQKPRNVRKECLELYNIPLKAIPSIKAGCDFVTEDGTCVPNERMTVLPAPSRSYAFCSDTAYSESYLSRIAGVDLLYHEATFLSSDASMALKTFHSTAADAARIALKSGAKKLIIGHYSSRYPDISVLEEEARSIFPETYAAKDGDCFEIS